MGPQAFEQRPDIGANQDLISLLPCINHHTMSMLNNIVTMDKTRVSDHILQTKWQSKKWIKKGLWKEAQQEVRQHWFIYSYIAVYIQALYMYCPVLLEYIRLV